MAQETRNLHDAQKNHQKIQTKPSQVSHIDEQWDMDLMDMNAYADENNGIRFVMVAIDIFSRYGWAVPLQNKTSKEVLTGFETLMMKAAPRKAQRIRTDAGKEFVNGQLARWFDGRNILHSVTRNEVKANYAERFIKTIKMKMVKYFQHRNSLRYVDHLDDLIRGYNNTYHRSIRMKPARVNEKNEFTLWEQQYVEPFLKEKTKKKTKEMYRFKVGDQVRISYLRRLFDREYDQTWTGEVFTVRKRWWRDGLPVYELDDYSKDPLKGTFYQPELQAVTMDPDDTFKIDQVIKTRGRGARKEHFVSWLNWPKKYNSWIPDTQLQKLTQ